MANKEEFIVIFKAEAADHITKLEKGLVELEKNTANLELVKELNMVAHTLKGSARVFGFAPINEIAHRIEDIFDRVLQKKMEFNSSIADKIFKGLDSVKAVLARDNREANTEIDVSAVCQGLGACLADAVAAAEPSSAPAQTPETKVTSGTAKAAPGAEEYIHVPLSRVNKLLNLSGEVVINKMKTAARIAQAKRLVGLIKDTQHLFAIFNESLKNEIHFTNHGIWKLFSQCDNALQNVRQEALGLGDNLYNDASHFDPVTDELQASLKEMRMLPLATIFEGLPRMVRDIASQRNKQVNLEIEGESTELDKKVLEGIKDPLIHILRNCVDHGIEDPEKRIAMGKPRAGTIRLTAGHEEGNVVIRVEDDGKGMDPEEIKQVAIKKNFITPEELEHMDDKEIVNIVFMNGYSTSPLITDISGRGIGFDIVRRGIENLKGHVILDTEKDRGTKITLALPLTIAIIRVLLLKAEGLCFGLPVTAIVESIKINSKDISTLEGKMAVQLRDHTLPLVRLTDVLGLRSKISEGEKKESTAAEEAFVVVISSLDKRVGFIIDEIIGEEEIFIRSLGRHLTKVNNVSGATILGTGEVLVILDAEDLIVNSRLSHPASIRKAPRREKRKEKKILVAEDALSTRELEKSILEAEGYLVDTAVDGLDALEKAVHMKYDLVMTDVQMPRMDGFQLCENLKKHEMYKDVPVVIVTSLSKEEDKRHGIEVGASAYIIKNAFDHSALLDAVERLIGQ